MRLRAALAAALLRRAAGAALVGASSPAAAPSQQALAAAASDPLLSDQLAGLRAGRAEGSCFDACGSCWYEEPTEPASVLCCCTPDCATFADCCADFGAVCVAPSLAAGAPLPDAQEVAAGLGVGGVTAPEEAPLAAAPLAAASAAAAPAPQPALPLMQTRPVAPPPLPLPPLAGGAVLPLAPRTALCGSACGGCIYADARLPATKLCCCLPDCLLFNDCCLDFREACAGVGLPPAPPERPFLPLAPLAPPPPPPPPDASPPPPEVLPPVVRPLPRPGGGAGAAPLLPERQVVSFILRAPAGAAPDDNFAEMYRRSVAAFADARPSDVAVVLLRGTMTDGADVPFFGELFLAGRGGGAVAADGGAGLPPLLLRTDVAFPAGSRSAPGALVDAVLDGALGEALSFEFPELAPLQPEAPTLHTPADDVSAFQLRPAPPAGQQPSQQALASAEEEGAPGKGLAPLSFCAQRSAARYYAAPRACDCGCDTCDCSGYWSCWGCDGGAGCRYGRFYECVKAPQSTFLDAAQACGWSRAQRNIFVCPPPPRSPPPPAAPERPPAPPLVKPRSPRAPYPPWPPYDPYAGGGPAAGSCAGACGRCLQSGGAFLCCCDAPCATWRLTPGQPPGFLGCCADAALACPANKTATPPAAG